MEKTHRRLARERETVQQMIRLYCREQHSPPDKGLCESCQCLHDYAMARLARCPFQADKPTCAKCPIHCYKPSMREQVRQVMRYAGPKMLLHHPVMAVLHLIDGFRRPPLLPAGTKPTKPRKP